MILKLAQIKKNTVSEGIYLHITRKKCNPFFAEKKKKWITIFYAVHWLSKQLACQRSQFIFKWQPWRRLASEIFLIALMSILRTLKRLTFTLKIKCRNLGNVIDYWTNVGCERYPSQKISCNNFRSTGKTHKKERLNNIKVFFLKVTDIYYD